MYTVQENVRIVISLLKKYGIHRIVLNPGGTNISIVQAVQDDSFFHCYSVVDERSAMYFAIGLYLQTGEIVATSCTSAQATRNYVPGLTEAFYKHVPILAITTSKLSWHGYQQYMQAPDQTSLPKDAVKGVFDLQPVTDENTRIQCIQSTREALLELTHHNPGPIQLNIRIDDAKQGQFEQVDLPKIRTTKRYMAWDDWSDVSLADKKVLVVVGEHRPFIVEQKEVLDKFCHSNNAVVYVNHLSNYHGEFAIQGNLLVSCGGLKHLWPDVIITIGGQTGDYSIYNALNSQRPAEHWRVYEDGRVVDTYSKLTKIFECPDWYFFNKLSKESRQSSHSYFEEWQRMNDTMNYNIEVPFSNLFAAQQLHNRIPAGSIMNFAILNSLRCWSYFPFDASIQGYANVAAFGIDGCNSMLIGESMHTDNLCFIVTGDLAFFYDMNALGIRHIKNNVRIMLVNNHGGAEFKIMTSSWKENVHVEDYIAANGHNGSAKSWAENCGFKYLSATNKEDFANVSDDFLKESPQPILLEIFTEEADEATAMRLFLSANRITTSEDKLKDVVASIVGQKGVKAIKKLMGR